MTLLDEAQGHTTAPQRFQELFELNRLELWQAMAQNPSVPMELALKLAHELPKESATNPLWPLALLESPNLWGKLPTRLLETFAASAERAAAVCAPGRPEFTPGAIPW